MDILIIRIDHKERRISLTGKEKLIAVRYEIPFEIFILPVVGFIQVGKIFGKTFLLLFGLPQFITPVIVIAHIQYMRGAGSAILGSLWMIQRIWSLGFNDWHPWNRDFLFFASHASITLKDSIGFKSTTLGIS